MLGKNKRLFVTLLMIGTLFLHGCGGDNPKKAKQSAYTIQDLDPRIAEAQLAFGMELYQQLRGGKEKEPTVLSENDFISPVSISTVLAMTANGAQDDTLEAMKHTLRFEGMNMDEINRGHLVLLDLLMNSNEEIEISAANAVWMKQGLDFKQPFLTQASDSYHAKLESLDLTTSAALRKINSWVSEETGGNIKEMIQEPLEDNVIMLLLNALYFNGNWDQPFNKKLTRPGTFHSQPGLGADTDAASSEVQMMSRSGMMSYMKGEGFQAVRLPYKAANMAMLVFLPDEDRGLDGFLDELTVDNWNQWLDNFAPRSGQLTMPRFEASYEVDLRKQLEQLGMAPAFSFTEANFQDMITIPDNNVAISRVKHKAFIDVQEEGTVAAAATVVEAMAGSAPPEGPFEMHVNRPFFYAIHDQATSSLLFMGSVRKL
ncbi:serpin family protein [Paenibacillaceae bacterium]|nr:serpin family protein [Paenibacillaceae bacterium]